MKKLILAFFVTSILSAIMAQSPAAPGYIEQTQKSPAGAISGIVMDELRNEPMAFAAVLVKEDDTLVAGVLADETGQFQLSNLKPGEYEMEIRFIGYETYKLRISSSELRGKRLFLTISLKEEPRCPCAVIIENQREIEFKQKDGSKDTEKGWMAEHMLNQLFGW